MNKEQLKEKCKRVRKDIELEYGVDITTKSRKQSYVIPRKIYCYVVRELFFNNLVVMADVINIPHDVLIYHHSTYNNDYNSGGFVDKLINKYKKPKPETSQKRTRITKEIVNELIKETDLKHYYNTLMFCERFKINNSIRKFIV